MDDLAWRLHSIPETFWPNPVFFVLPSQIPVECRSRYVSVIQICPGWTISVLPALAHLCYKGISALISISLTGAGSRHGPRGGTVSRDPDQFGGLKGEFVQLLLPNLILLGAYSPMASTSFWGGGEGGRSQERICPANDALPNLISDLDQCEWGGGVDLKREFVQLVLPSLILLGAYNVLPWHWNQPRSSVWLHLSPVCFFNCFYFPWLSLAQPKPSL